ncbi:N-acetyltransferase family protein [Aerococcus urinaeequi]|uniref:GNAT family N-acetyltransferase n=1 Tax=Aerococcus urinaeequi TaxID=51665 RepID=UPI003D6A7303
MSREAMAERIAVIPDTFILETDQEGTILGYVVGSVIKDRYLHDDLFEKTVANPAVGGYVGVLSLVVDPVFHGQGIASKFLDELADRAKKSGRVGISLTCL